MLAAAGLVLALLPPAEAGGDALAGVELVGVVLSPDAARSSAVLRTPERTRVVVAGDAFFGAHVGAIAAGQVTLETAHGPVVLRLSAASAPAAAPLTAPTAAETPDSQGRVFERAELERRLADETPRILAETALIPVQEDGRVNGFVLSRLPEGSLLTDAGLMPGDVITEINGTPIDSMATLIGLYARLRHASEVRATVLRGGSPVSLLVRLR